MLYKVLVVDDSQFFRRIVSNIVNADPSLEVIDVAIDGKDAIEKVKKLKPDVIIMDIEMPVMDGITAVRHIMQEMPTPILMFSSFTRDGAKATLDALDAGALDFFPKVFENKVAGSEDPTKLFQQKLRSLARKRPFSLMQSSFKPVSNSSSSIPVPTAPLVAFKTTNKDYQVIAIGCSTGGPAALQKVLTSMPANFPYPIILVQHMPATFTGTFAERLNLLCKIKVREVMDGDVLQPRTAYVAPGGMQLVAKKNATEVKLEVYDTGEEINYKPSVDITFSSLADIYKDKVLAIILTGMGTDGEKGAGLLKQNGSTVWAQDEQSSIVYGMPQAVVKTGIATESLPIDRIAERILVELKLRS